MPKCCFETIWYCICWLIFSTSIQLMKHTYIKLYSTHVEGKYILHTTSLCLAFWPDGKAGFAWKIQRGMSFCFAAMEESAELKRKSTRIKGAPTYDVVLIMRPKGCACEKSPIWDLVFVTSGRTRYLRPLINLVPSSLADHQSKSIVKAFIFLNCFSVQNECITFKLKFNVN